MPPEKTLADYLDDALPQDERAALEELFLQAPEPLAEIVAQEKLDAALRALLGEASELEQIKQGIMADIGAGPMNQTKRRVLVDMAAHKKKRRERLMEWRIAGISFAAAAGIVLMLMLWQSRTGKHEIVEQEPSPPVTEKQRTEETLPVPQKKQPAPEFSPVITHSEQNAPVAKPDRPLVAQNTIPSTMKETRQSPDKSVVPVVPTNVAVVQPLVKPATPVVVATLRDVAEWPFASDSPWNQPIGSAAKYAPVRFAVREKFDADKIGLRTRPVLRDVPDGVPHRVLVNGQEAGSFHLVMPPNRFNGNDQPVSILNRDATTVMELRDVDFSQQGVISAKSTQSMDLRGTGFGGGLAESGGSAFGGVVRSGEAMRGIHHALAIAVNLQWLSTKGGRLHVWPATSGPPYPAKSFAKPGNVQLGTLLAIPPTVSIEKLNVGAKGTPGYELAKALQDYGAYVTETCRWQQFHFYFSDADVPGNITDILARLAKELHVVTNNTSATPGGGGTLRAQLAPAPPK